MRARLGAWHRLREACNELISGGAFRVPKVYQVSVQIVVLSATFANVIHMAAQVGEAFQQEERATACAALAWSTSMLLVLVVPVTLIVQVRARVWCARYVRAAGR